MITIEQARKVLETVDAGLVRGLGEPIPGKMCIEAAVCYALGELHCDSPSCVSWAVRNFKIRLNDGEWSSDSARSAGMRKLAIAQLGSKGNIDEAVFSTILAKLTIQRVLPPIFRKIGLGKEAARCETEGSAAAARAAAAAADAHDAADAAAADAHDAAADAAVAAAYAAAAASAYAVAAAYAAAYAAVADAAARDFILLISADCCLAALRQVNAPGIRLLEELGI